MTELESIIDKAEDAYADGDTAKAKRYYAKAIALDKNCVEALEWLGELHVQDDKLKEALKFYERAIALNPDFNEHANLGYCYYELGDCKKAVPALRQAIMADGKDHVSHSNYGKALYDYFINADADEARRLALEWRKKFPKNKDAQYMGAAISGKYSPKVAEVGFIRETFDDFAEDFDKKLTELEYAAPKLLAELFTEYGHADIKRVLDLGCGTGLLGIPLRKLLPKAHLLGVDLSSKMLKLARARKLYTKLQCEEIVKWLKDNRKLPAFELITAADVFCYFGDLLPLLKGAEKLMPKHGLLLFSIELGTPKELNDEGNYGLHVSGRYRHSKNYPAELAEAVGLRLLCAKKDVLRTEYGKPVYGLLVAMQKD